VWLKDGQIIGFLRFNDIDEQGRLDFGHVFHTEYRRDGYDTEAIRHVLPLAFGKQEVTMVIGRNHPHWKGQVEPLLELGFADRRGGRGVTKDDAGRDIIENGMVELTKEEWEEKRR